MILHWRSILVVHAVILHNKYGVDYYWCDLFPIFNDLLLSTIELSSWKVLWIIMMLFISRFYEYNKRSDLIFYFSWVFGDFLCKMYQFVHSLSYTASIFILMVICTERYFAIIHPITCKQILTSTRLRVRELVYILSSTYS